MAKYIVVFVTCKNLREAKRIAGVIIREKLSACVNIISPVLSFFIWEKKFYREKEVLLVIKSRTDVYKKLQETIKKYHSYTVPEIIALPIIRGNPSYLKWILESTK
jgi:periplasmic divalent cation tolerance protein